MHDGMHISIILYFFGKFVLKLFFGLEKANI